ncbi:MAG: anaerobic ribonucleoside-triphosphate reductase activating protein [Lachnospiraceae bacterium]|jgi:anaerobic ribonucleoside-triphosphate reductase activating protein|nr:anaerobic ribonucleoside-triphosphate reductase activating protein [Lachnospiraceae bacterium]
MNYATIKKNDIANGPGIRVSLFVSGCRHHCKNCFNQEAWDFDYGVPFTQETIDEILTALSPSYVAGLSLLGGEPFEPENQEGLLSLARQFRQRFPEKNLWCYTGFSFQKDLLGDRIGNPGTVRELLSYFDVLVDGKFIEAKKDPSLLFRGSSNQNIIDVKKSLAQDQLVLLKGTWKRAMGSGNIDE